MSRLYFLFITSWYLFNISHATLLCSLITLRDVIWLATYFVWSDNSCDVVAILSEGNSTSKGNTTFALLTSMKGATPVLMQEKV